LVATLAVAAVADRVEVSVVQPDALEVAPRDVLHLAARSQPAFAFTFFFFGIERVRRAL
jgi:hypothetical protein